MLYIAGADHFPVAALRQTIGPRPPLAPIPNPNFLTAGRTRTQSAFAITSDGMFWSLSICCSTFPAFLRVCSSLSLLAGQTGRPNRTKQTATSPKRRRVLAYALCLMSHFDIASLLRLWPECHQQLLGPTRKTLRNSPRGLLQIEWRDLVG